MAGYPAPAWSPEYRPRRSRRPCAHGTGAKCCADNFTGVVAAGVDLVRPDKVHQDVLVYEDRPELRRRQRTSDRFDDRDQSGTSDGAAGDERQELTPAHGHL